MAKVRRRFDISSRDNEHFKWVRDLWNSKDIRENNACLVFGAKIIQDLVLAQKIKILYECLRGNDASLTPDSDVFQFSPALFDEIDQFGAGRFFVVAEAPKIEPWVHDPLPQPSGLELVCPFSDPQNLGAAVRSAVAFGVKQIILTKEAAHPFLPKSIRASAGAVFDMHFKNAPSLQETCELLRAYPVGTAVLMDIKGPAIEEFNWMENMFLAFGEEGQGVPVTKLAHVSISMQNVESLNAAVAASLGIFSYRMKFPLRKPETKST